MKHYGRLTTALAGMLLTLAVFAQDFKPYKLVGEWAFTNTQTGTRYGGPMEVSLNSVDSKGVIKGMVSYDGRQTNDKCSTKAFLTDKPVEAEITKAGNEYRVTYQLECAVNPSPRITSLTLVCTDDGVCTRPYAQPWGKGMTTLREVR